MTANEDSTKSPSGTKNARENYTFQFETRRKDGSIRKPAIHVVMEFGELVDGIYAGTEFSQAEAMGLWEAVIKTLRPRPGAV